MRDMEKARLIHEEVHTVDAFNSVVSRWAQKQYDTYSIGIFAFHGDPGVLWLGRRKIELEDLAELLRGKCAGRVIHFDSCGVLDVPKRRIDAFRKTTGARCVTGYTENVDWYQSTALTILLLAALTSWKHMDAVERHLLREHRGLSRMLGFKMHYGT